MSSNLVCQLTLQAVLSPFDVFTEKRIITFTHCRKGVNNDYRDSESKGWGGKNNS